MGTRTVTERSAIDRMLASHGLGRLEDGAGMLAQLGFLVRDHEHFRSLLARSDPEHRSGMYDSLKPYLRFQAHELSWYMAESARLAEARQLPTVDGEGTYHWPSDARPTGLCTCEGPGCVYMDGETAMCKRCRRPLLPGHELQARAQEAVNEAFSVHHLLVTCRSCTRQDRFSGDTKADAIRNARHEGWVYYERDGVPQEICPECPAVRPAPKVSRLSPVEFNLVSEFKSAPHSTISRYLAALADGSQAEWDAAALDAARRWDADGRPGMVVQG